MTKNKHLCGKYALNLQTGTRALPLSHSLIRKMREHYGAFKVQNYGF